MSNFAFLVFLAACTVLLCDAAATVVITAPSTVIERTSELETREQGPTSWICSALVVESPWTAYANIRGYLEGGNSQGKNYTNLVLYPVMELFHSTQDQSRLCVYLPAEDHCYPPAPNSGAVKTVKQLTKRTYFAIRFWGQASNARVQFYKQKLTKSLATYNKAAMLDLFFVSFFSDHVREVRYDPATAVTEPLEDKTPKGQCPATSRRETLAGVDTSIRMLVKHARLAMPDVQWDSESGINTIDECKQLSYFKGFDAFSFNIPYCTLYNFGKDFCPCEGTKEIFVQRKRLEKNEGLWQTPPHTNKRLDRIIMFTEIPVKQFLPQLSLQTPANVIPDCERDLLTPGKKPSMSAVFYAGGCFLSSIHDAVNCNQTCRGDSEKALVRKVNTNPIVHFLSNCGKNLQVTAKSEQESSIYLSHPGIGCYYYPESKSVEEGGCTITFEKAPTAQTLEVVFDYVNLDRPSTGCQDKLTLYNGRTMSTPSTLITLCNGDGQQRVSVQDVVTVHFYRAPNFEGTEVLVPAVDLQRMNRRER